MMNNFVHLNTKSDYSLSEGALTIEKIADLCSENNMPAIAVTDTNNLFGALEFSETISSICPSTSLLILVSLLLLTSTSVGIPSWSRRR